MISCLKPPVAAVSVALITSCVWAAEKPSTVKEFKTAKNLKVPDNVEVRPDVVYGKGGDRDLELDLFLPRQGKASRPAIVFIHGGGWRGGNRTQFHPQAAYLAGKGYVGACIEYRLSKEAQYPAAVEDAKCAVRWLRAHARQLNVDPDRIASCGGSAGGHLAAMLGTTDKSDALEGAGGWPQCSSKVNLVVDFNGAFDLVPPKKDDPIKDSRIQFFGGTYAQMPEKYEQASPIRHVDKSDPPFLFLHGTADTTVPFEQAERMAEALRDAGVEAVIDAAEGAKHGYFNRPPHYQPTLHSMKNFLDEHFRPNREKGQNG